MRRRIPLVSLLVVALCAATAVAEIDEFEIMFDADGEIVGGSGTGYDDGTGVGGWYYYPLTRWWNQWFYNGPKDFTRWKEVEVWITIDPAGPGAEVGIVYNWATCEWPPDVPPPLPDPGWTLEEEQRLIGRLVDEPIFVGEVPENMSIAEYRSFRDIIPFNPEWISIDVRGRDVLVTGRIEHHCVPEPACTILLLAGGAMLTAGRRRRSG